MNPFNCDCVLSIRGGYTCLNCRLKQLEWEAAQEEKKTQSSLPPSPRKAAPGGVEATKGT